MKIVCSIFLAVLSLAAFARGSGEGTGAETESTEVNVYSSRHYNVDRVLFERFTSTTGIVVNTVFAGADEVIERLRNEGEQSQADLLILVDAHHLYRAKNLGLFQEARALRDSEALSLIDSLYRDSEDHWIGITKRARIIVADKRRSVATSLNYEDLADPSFANSLLIRSSSNIYNISLLSSIVVNEGADAALEWARAVRANMARPPQGNDRDQMRALIAGVASYALVNTYYVGLLSNSEDPADQVVGNNIAVIFPNQKDRGTHISVTGAGITAHAANPAQAAQLLEYLLSAEAQKFISDNNYEYPVRSDVEPSPVLAAWGEFTEDTSDLELVAQANAEAVRIFDAANWE